GHRGKAYLWAFGSPVRLDRDKHRVNLRQLLRIINPHHPAAICLAVHIEYAKVRGQCLLSLRRFPLPPDLKTADQPWLADRNRKRRKSETCPGCLELDIRDRLRGILRNAAGDFAIRTIPMERGFRNAPRRKAPGISRASRSHHRHLTFS